MNKEDIASTIKSGLSFVLGIFIVAMCYNLLLLPNNFVVGGLTGISVIINEVFHYDPAVFIFIASMVLLVISYFCLGKEITRNNTLGSIVYPIMISATEPICNVILENVVIEEFLLKVILAGILFGLGNGIIYKNNYTTGGGDIIMQLLSKYLKISTATAFLPEKLIIIFISGFVFGLESVLYSLVIVLLGDVVVDRIVVGISNSKIFYISSTKLDDIKDIVSEKIKSGYTTLKVTGIKKDNKEMLMVVVSNREYHRLKELIKEIDKDAFFIISDSYEVKKSKKVIK